MKKIAINVILILNIMGCNAPNDKSVYDIDKLISSNSPDSLIEGFYLIGKYKRTEYIPKIFDKIDDPRITHNIYFKGRSVYQSKVSALRQISGLEPPIKITYKPDTAIINFYYKWARDTGYLNP